MEIIIMLLFSVFLLLAAVTLQNPVNRISITGTEHEASCTLWLANTEEVVDLRTDCPLAHASAPENYYTLIQFIKRNASYLIKEGRAVRGYRYFKDPLNYKYKEYDLERYHHGLQRTLEEVQLSAIALPSEQRFRLTVTWQQDSQLWQLSSLCINYSQPISWAAQVQNYEVKSWLSGRSSQKSISLRKLAGKGPKQAINVTLELTMQDQARIQADRCKVVIQQILPEWLFVDYDFLHTLAKYEVFEIELPEHFSKQMFFKYTVPFAKFSKSGPHSYTYQYKVGVRYPRPTNDGSYFVQVGLHPNDRISIECQGQQPIQVEEDLLNDRGHGSMFAGREQDAKRVTMVTYLVTIVLSVLAVKAVKVPKEPK